jgi:hypothetical protein
MNNGSIASGTLLVIAGVWVMFQTLVGDLPGRILSLSNAGTPRFDSGNPRVDQYGNADPNGQFSEQTGPDGRKNLVPVIP